MNDVLIRINNFFNDLSPNHQQIATYILHHPDEIKNLSARELAKKTYSVPSSIISFSKKIGFSGFQEMKFNYINDHLNNDQNNSEVLRPYKIVEGVLSTKSYKDVVKVLLGSKRIYIFAFQMSQIPALDFYYKVRKVNPSKIIFFRSFDDQVRNIPLLTKNDTVLMVSNSGECQEIIDCQKYLPKGIKKILITNGVNSTLSNFSDYELSIGCFEKDILLFKEIPTSSRDALLNLLDNIFIDMIKPDYKNNLKKIRNSSLFFN